MKKIKEPLRLLIEEETLPSVYRDHSLTGDWSGCSDLHIEPDRLLIYRIIGNVVRFERTGSHSDLFRSCKLKYVFKRDELHMYQSKKLVVSPML